MLMGALLAAGASTRFGAEDKLLAAWRGEPLVTWPARALCAAGCDMVIAVVSSPSVAAVLPAGMRCLSVGTGLPMSASFGAALREARRRKARGLVLCLGDMPNVTPGLLHRLSGMHGTAACLQGTRRLPPALIAAGDFAHALTLSEGDHGARALIAALPPARLLPIPSAEALDIDTIEDLRHALP
ncbi:nucleotidyltransferase family protein [Paracoccus spongiarum]|uniref:NTP transferase domain-containing protein n=1 Tax=Paracoccus spongiarum TaxID=3064387 RepID=A0ABT9J9D1_9RHOB|nr:NTP transferase domain-containing protein [Paracoccus sp. 2205BS29-5]MDP5306427.1 NTP transferase domain-containing protein [Paracoccus sp. 2205BS29-5]